MSEGTWVWVALAAAVVLDLLIAASRSALGNSRQPELERREAAGVSGAGLAGRVAADATRWMSSLQAGQGLVHLLALALGVRGVLQLTHPAARTLASGVVVLGGGVALAMATLLADSLVRRSPERWAVALAWFASSAVRVFSPLGWLSRRIAAVVLGASAGAKRALVTEEAILTLVDAGQEGGVIEVEEKQMIFSIFRLGDTLAREVMVPRIDILALEEHTRLEQAADALLQAGHSRAPVYAGTIDNIIGLLYAKDLLAAWRAGPKEQLISGLLREAYFVPEAKKADDLLAEMQDRRVHMAIVVDEYGGTAGVVTIEDIVEEIVGEIRDEYDATEEAPYQALPDGAFVLSGRIGLDQVGQLLGVEFHHAGSETLGGLVFSLLGRVPAPGEVVETGGLRLVVEQVSGKRIRTVRATRSAGAVQEMEPHGTDPTRAG